MKRSRTPAAGRARRTERKREDARSRGTRGYERPRIVRSYSEEELLREVGDVFLGTGQGPFKPEPGGGTPTPPFG